MLRIQSGASFNILLLEQTLEIIDKISQYELDFLTCLFLKETEIVKYLKTSENNSKDVSFIKLLIKFFSKDVTKNSKTLYTMHLNSLSVLGHNSMADCDAFECSKIYKMFNNKEDLNIKENLEIIKNNWESYSNGTHHIQLIGKILSLLNLTQDMDFFKFNNSHELFNDFIKNYE